MLNPQEGLENQGKDEALFILPSEVLLSMMTYLDSQALARIEQTCITFQGLASDEQLWKAIAEREIVEPLPRIMTSGFKKFVKEKTTQEEAQFCDKFLYYFEHLSLLHNGSEFRTIRETLNKILNIVSKEKGMKGVNQSKTISLHRNSQGITIRFSPVDARLEWPPILLSKLKFEQFKFLILSKMGRGKKKQIEGQVYLDFSPCHPAIVDKAWDLVVEKMQAKFPGEVEAPEKHPGHLKIGPKVQAFIQACKEPQVLPAPEEQAQHSRKYARIT